MVDEGPRIELDKATKRFGELVAVDSLDLTLEPGRVHAIIGENGAGKSTALKMIAGSFPASEGVVKVGGSQLSPATTQQAIARGVGMVHQHFMLIETFTALENLVLGSEPTGRLGALDLESAREQAISLGKKVGLPIDLDRVTAQLTVGERQRLEILRVLNRDARAILLDEPTAVLSPVEVAELYKTLRRLADGGATIAVVTHRLDEVVQYCDHVTVMRQGAGVLDEPIDRDEPREKLLERLTRSIMGGEVPKNVDRARLGQHPEPALVVKNMRARRRGGGDALRDFDLTIQPGEIVGMAGVEGNGQRELARVLSGLEPLLGGTVEVAGRSLFEVESSSPHDRSAYVRRARAAGLLVVHEDRHKDELVLSASVGDNLVLGDLDAVDDELVVVEKRFARFDVNPRDPSHTAEELSGGNQQKVVMARALDRPLEALVLAQPTRGVDVGTAHTIHQAISDAASKGAAILLISVDLHELRRLSHRIVVIRRGRIVAELEPSASDAQLGRAMLGTSEDGTGEERREAMK